MKRVGNLYNKIDDLDVIIDMYEKHIKNNIKNKNVINKFDKYYTSNIINIKNIIHKNSYIPGKYNIFLIKEPKIRIIMSQKITDKIINHLVAKYFLIDIFDKTLIDSNVATRLKKGTHYGLKLFKRYLNNFKNKYDNFYVLKFDIKKYFYNIDHDIVKRLISNKIKDKKVIDIINKIIDSTDESYVNESIKKLGDDLPFYQKGKGLPIGNMTSQIIATFYLNELDYYIKYKLKISAYVRYMDDGILIHKDKMYLKFCLKEIEKMVNKYKLELNSKTKIYSSSEEIEFLGFRFLLKNRIIMKVNNKTKKRFIRKIKYDCNMKVLQSYLGYFKWGNCNGLINKVLSLQKTTF